VALKHAGIKRKRSIPLFDLVNELGPCCPDPLTRTHSGKHFAAMLGSITTIMSSDCSAIPQRWRPNWPIVAGIKRATASLARNYGEGRESIPRPGDFVMMLDGEGRPRFIWRTTEVAIKPLSQVDDAFAWDERQGDRTQQVLHADPVSIH
jgi:hypothetical protein